MAGTKPLTQAERSARSHAKQAAAGWRRVNLRLPPEAARLLAEAEARHGSATAAIIAALRRLTQA